ncbi:hypothetical protein PTTG_25125 [Puccinia triticina 1-1 BBBD Race 1]|uniref:Replication termination factor 2 n=2 Tax=Puccinia triticina TaxID=208348 RepID=A0A180H600_PUCT1|nr:uncharacterized protein PtA15_9A265 [Puccinia triticina]OAV99979.1 hypothetical protein PTTG_25125 [Puccinia triticina 1-1 BBBD Race 1]WAQ88140.1 hypothetical protein PtA15_9A265 [Puccinia triticina]WAR60330.1 hypothetical protein PtB15_9B267 [Puccinia triticina]
MGNDGGSIPKRDDLVRTRAGKSRVDEQEKQSTKWSECSLSKQKLEEPIVCDRLGKLYNKSSVLEFLIDRNHFGQDGKQVAGHLRSLKDVVNVQLAKNTQSNSWICPISLKEFGIGIGRFELRWLCLVDCGCILTEPGLKQVDGNNCPVCGKPVAESITVNPSAEEEENVRFKLLEQRVKEQEEKDKRKLERKAQKKRKNNQSTDEGAFDADQGPKEASKKMKTITGKESSIQPPSNINSSSISKITTEIQKETQQSLVNLSSSTLSSIYGPRDANGKQLLGQQKESWMTRGTWTRYAA